MACMSPGHSPRDRVQVLVVGAGPVGLVAALRLRQQGVEVRLIDQQPEQRAHTFPVVLHPQTLRLLTDLGVLAALFWRGRPVKHLAVYSEGERRAVLDLPQTLGPAGVLTLPQDILRQALTNELTRHGVEIEHNTRLAVLQQDARSVWGRLIFEDPARLVRSGKVESAAFEADFVIGADGYESTVRDAVGLRLVGDAAVQTFAFFDATTHRAGSEAQLAFADDYGNSVYPLQGGQSRFTFQIGRGLNNLPDASALRELLQARMPWHVGAVVSFDWGGIAEFRRALVNQFGIGRVWLAGEAAHLTGPLGVQSLNVGMDEAHELASHIGAESGERGKLVFGAHYESRRRQQWEKLLGFEDYAQLRARSPDWARRYAKPLTAALPASGEALDDLLAQLRLLPSSTGRTR